MIPIKTASAWRGTSDCRSCGIRDMVLFADLKEEDFELIHAPIDDFEFDVGHSLISAGAEATVLFTLRAGDVIGLEALMAPVYDADAVTLTPVQVCRLPLQVIQRLNRETPRLHQRLLGKWHQSLKDADDWLAELNFGNARQRVAGLILKMRSAADPTVVTLFSREDMGAMLDLKLETVSRTLSTFVREGLVEPMDKQGRQYRVLNAVRLLSPSE